jgi:hypothetical protein
MHVRTFYAAVSGELPSADGHNGPARQSPHARPTQTLWAERPLQVRGGRLTAVRLSGDQLQVGFVPDSTGSLRWVRPESLLSEQEAQAWARCTRFRP